ncbi:MAG: ElyC/SanA/YdcF family protein [Dermatophilaceae bacterium]
MTRRRKLLIAAGVITAGVLAVPVGANAWIAGEASGHTYAVADVPPAPVALVFGAGLTPDKQPSPYLAYRLDIAKALFDAGKVQVILVSGDNRTHAYDEPTAMLDYLVAHGVPAGRIVRDFAGRDTYDSCARAKRIFGVDHLIAVTQAYHLPRAVATCRALGIQADGVGDTQGERFRDVWSAGSDREKLAALKAVADVVTRRDPVLGRQENGIRDALVAASAGH